MNFYTKELTLVYFDKIKAYICDKCDTRVENDKHYVIRNPQNSFESSRTYCEKCIYKNQIVDWEES